ncbi:aldo/keto reductase [Agromyces sp. NPDC056965]|uniref:aldo/keto reductase n=1 Tax=Agromyces sp. NPDC056965 TaxID=3345983 RepID=UPI0036416ACB
MPALAAAFPLAHRAVTSVILGPRTLSQLESLLEAAAVELDDDVLDLIDEIVPPGTDVYAPNGAFAIPWLVDPHRRRRAVGRPAGSPND